MLLAGLSAIAPQANADFLIEPYVGYYTGDIKDSSGKSDMKGMGYGARLGYTSLGFMGGLDYFTGKWTIDNTPEVDVTPTDIGIFVGFNFPILIRAYGEYLLKSELKGDAGKYEGKGVKLGVGFTPLPLISVNVEYVTHTFDEFDGNSLTSDTTTKMIGLTVSLPFSL